MYFLHYSDKNKTLQNTRSVRLSGIQNCSHYEIICGRIPQHLTATTFCKVWLVKISRYLVK